MDDGGPWIHEQMVFIHVSLHAASFLLVFHGTRISSAIWRASVVCCVFACMWAGVSRLVYQPTPPPCFSKLEASKALRFNVMSSKREYQHLNLEKLFAKQSFPVSALNNGCERFGPERCTTKCSGLPRVSPGFEALWRAAEQRPAKHHSKSAAVCPHQMDKWPWKIHTIQRPPKEVNAQCSVLFSS